MPVHLQYNEHNIAASMRHGSICKVWATSPESIRAGMQEHADGKETKVHACLYTDAICSSGAPPSRLQSQSCPQAGQELES